MESKETTDSLKVIECSAASKVLITGWYLIIEPYYQGIVLSGSARLKTTLKIHRSEHTCDSNIKIICKSPQMGQKIWIFTLSQRMDSSNGLSVILKTDESDSGYEFTHSILITFFSLLPHLQNIAAERISEFISSLKSISTLEFEFIGDESLYSFKPEDSSDKKEIKELCKTGMGSSATFITSFIGSLYAFVSAETPDSDASLNEINILSQIANSVWQKKIGSGFDIAAAVYGSLIYKRYTVSKEFTQIVEDIENMISKNSFVDFSLSYSKFYSEFDFIPKRLLLPNSFQLWMVSTASGSDTRVMVKQLMQWSTENMEPWSAYEGSIFTNEHWQNLATIGMQIAETLEQIKDIEQLEPPIADDWEDTPTSFKDKVQKLRELNDLMRQQLISITEKSGVQVEPQRVTNILNQIKSKVKNVVMCGVPGAGGDDAVYILYYSTKDDQKEERRRIT